MLSVAVLLGWQFFYAGPKLKEEQERQARIRLEQQQAQAKEQTPPNAPATTPAATPGKQGTVVPGPASVTTAASREARCKCEPARCHRDAELKGSIALKGGRIDDLVLAKYHETVDPKSPNVVLFSPSGPRIRTLPNTAGSRAPA